MVTRLSIPAFRATACLLVVFLCSRTASAIELLPEQLVYREAFPNNTSQNNTATVGWQAHEGPTATQIGGIAVGDPVHLAVGGAPTPNPPPINSGPDPIVTGGRTFHDGTSGFAQIFWTDEHTLTGGLVPTRVQWFTLHSSPAQPVSAAVRVGASSWFVTDTVASNTGTVDSGWTQREIDLLATDWRPLPFIPNTSMGVPGAPISDLPGGPITAFGIFEDAFTANLRFDTFELFAAQVVPEPSTFGLIFGGTWLFLAYRRKRRRTAVFLQ